MTGEFDAGVITARVELLTKQVERLEQKNEDRANAASAKLDDQTTYLRDRIDGGLTRLTSAVSELTQGFVRKDEVYRLKEENDRALSGLGSRLSGAERKIQTMEASAVTRKEDRAPWITVFIAAVSTSVGAVLLWIGQHVFNK